MASGDSSDTMNVDVDSSSDGGDEAAAPSGPPPRLMISKMVRFDLLVLVMLILDLIRFTDKSVLPGMCMWPFMRIDNGNGKFLASLCLD